MKKLLWLLPVALLAIGSFTFLGCPSEQGEWPEGDVITKFDLNAYLRGYKADTPEALKAGDTFSDSHGIFRDNPYLVAAGSPACEVIETEVTEKDNDGNNVKVKKLGLKFTTNDTWGVGIDFKNAGIKFGGGDVVSITGKAESGTKWMLDINQGGAEKALGGEDCVWDGDVKLSGDDAIEMTQAEANSIAGVKSLRLNCKENTATFALYTFVVKGAQSLVPDRVTSIEGIPKSIVKDIQFTLGGNIFPDYALNDPKSTIDDPLPPLKEKKIVWTLEGANSTSVKSLVDENGKMVDGIQAYQNTDANASDDNNGKYLITPSKLGTLNVKATVVGGRLDGGDFVVGGDFVEEFAIEVVEVKLPVLIGTSTQQAVVIPGQFSWNTDLSVDDFGNTADGFVTYSIPNGYNAWVYFKVNLGVKSPSDIDEIHATVIVLDEDGEPSGFKDVKFGFTATEPTTRSSNFTGSYNSGGELEEDNSEKVVCTGSSALSGSEVWVSMDIAGGDDFVVTVQKVEIIFK